MINSKTVRILNKYGYGTSIDDLENFLISYNELEKISDIRIDEEVIRELTGILKEIKVDSCIFDESTLTEIDEELDDLIKKYPYKNKNYIYGLEDNTLDKLKNDFFSGKSVIAIENIVGIYINSLYINGYLYKIFICGGDTNYLDITKLYKPLIPSFIEDLSDYDIVSLRGKITNKHNKYENTKELCRTWYEIKNGINILDKQIVFNNIYIEDNEDTFKTNWDKLEFMKELELTVADYSMSIDVIYEMLEKAIVTFYNYFLKENKCNEIELRINDNVSNNSFIYTGKQYKDGFIASTKVKSIRTDYSNDEINLVLGVVNIEFEDYVLNTIKLDDLCDIDKYNIKIGSKVNVKVINNELKLIQ